VDPEATIQDLLARFPDLTVEVQGTDAHYIFRKNPGWEAFCDHNGCPWAYADTDKIPRPFLKFSIYGQFRDVTVASMYQATPEEQARIDAAVAYVVETYGDQVDAFRACGVDPTFYTTRGFGEGEILPWDTIDVGVNKKFLLRERKQAYDGKVTPDCRHGCSGCGAICLLEEVVCDA
jgi:hypothetical protein